MNKGKVNRGKIEKSKSTTFLDVHSGRVHVTTERNMEEEFEKARQIFKKHYGY